MAVAKPARRGPVQDALAARPAAPRLALLGDGNGRIWASYSRGLVYVRLFDTNHLIQVYNSRVSAPEDTLVYIGKDAEMPDTVQVLAIHRQPVSMEDLRKMAVTEPNPILKAHYLKQLQERDEQFRQGYMDGLLSSAEQRDQLGLPPAASATPSAQLVTCGHCGTSERRKEQGKLTCSSCGAPLKYGPE